MTFALVPVILVAYLVGQARGRCTKQRFAYQQGWAHGADLRPKATPQAPTG